MVLFRNETMALDTYKNDIPICKQESGQRPDLHTAMEDIENTVKYLMNQNINNDA